MSFSFDIPNPGRASKNTTSHISVQVDELCREREICGHLIRQLLGIIALSQNHGATLGDLHDELGEYFARWADDAGVELIPLSGKPNDKPQPRV